MVDYEIAFSKVNRISFSIEKIYNCDYVIRLGKLRIYLFRIK